MLEFSFFGQRCARRVTDDESKVQSLHSYGYIHIASYRALQLGASFSLRKKETLIIDLTQSMEVIFAAFNKTGRNEIHKTERDTDYVFTVLDKNIRKIYSLHKKFERAQGRRPIPKAEFTKGQIFAAYYKNELVAAISTYSDDTNLRINQIFSLRLEHRKETEVNMRNVVSCASRRLVYEICLYGKQEKIKTLDFCIVNLTDPSKGGINQFKSSFGGQLVDTYIYNYRTNIFRYIEKIVSSFVRIW